MLHQDKERNSQELVERPFCQYVLKNIKYYRRRAAFDKTHKQTFAPSVLPLNGGNNTVCALRSFPSYVKGAISQHTKQQILANPKKPRLQQ